MFQAPSNGQVAIWCESGTSSPLNDTQLVLYDACGGNEIACDDDGGSDSHARLELGCDILIPGNTYYLQVDGYAGATGNFILHIDLEDVNGCTNLSAANYNACATVDDGSCNFLGCTDPEACNFNSNALTDNGSCCYGNCIELTVTGGLYPSEIYYVLESSNGTDFISTTAGSAAPLTSAACLPDGCYRLLLSDVFGDGWNGATYTLRFAGGLTIATGGFDNDPFYDAFQKSISFTLGGGTVGCTNPTACNFDPTASCDDGSCDLVSCFGCTNSGACNFSPAALQDDGSCCFSNCGNLELYDLSQDGWDNGSFTIYGQGNTVMYQGTMSVGTEFEEIVLCLPEGCYYLEVDPGDFPEEVSYSISGFGDQVIIGDGFQPGPHYFSVGESVCLGCTQVSACNYNPWAIFDDGTCISGPCVLGDNPWTALPITLGSLSVCASRDATHVGATATSIAQSEAITGEDIWYRFTAITNAVRLTATSLSNNIVLELLDADFEPVAMENSVAGPSMEALNLDQLTPGAVYYLGIRDFNAADGLGAFSICLSSIGRSGCNSPSGNYSMCSSFKANFSAATSYVFNFVSASTSQEYNLTVPGTITKINLHQVPNLTWNDTYTTRVDAIYNLTNGAGAIETIVMPGSSCSITISAQTNMVVRSSFSCTAGSVSRFATLIADPWVCGATGAEWEFTDTDGITPAFTRISLSNDRRMSLTPISGIQFGKTYQVRIRPIFTYGNGTYGPPTCVQIVAAPALAPTISSNQLGEQKSFENNGEEYFLIYPNPSSGERVLLDLPQSAIGESTISIRNIQGKVVYQQTWELSSWTGVELIMPSTLSSGMYLMSFENKGKLVNRKWLVQAE
jgi:hypothetical protein